MPSAALRLIPYSWNPPRSILSWQRVLHYLLSHVQPRLQGKVQAVLHEPDAAFFSDKAGKYVGMFVRKKEGRTYKSLKMTETLVRV